MVLVLVAEAYVSWLVGGLMYLARVGASWATYGRFLAQQIGAIRLWDRGSSSGMRTLLDESAAQLREVGELSVQEARALQRNLQRLAERLRELEDEPLAEPRRYARAKR